MNRSSWTLGTVDNPGFSTGLPARRHIGHNVIQVATEGNQWRSATALETASFRPLPVAQMPV